MRKFMMVGLLALVLALMLGGGVAMAQDGATETVTVIEVIDAGGVDWLVIRELLTLIGQGVLSIVVILVVWNSTPAKSLEKTLSVLDDIAEKIITFQDKAALTPTPIDDIVGYLAKFGADQLTEAIQRKIADAQKVDDDGKQGLINNPDFG